MAGTFHFPEKAHQQFMEKFNIASETDDMFTHELDMEFSGVKTVHVFNVKTENLQDYNRSIEVGTGSRYGTTHEVKDEEQVFTMTQDKSLSLSIDKGNNKEIFNLKKAGTVMKAEREEVIVPFVDRYRLHKWANNAGIAVEFPAAPSKTNIVETILDAKSAALDKGVPDKLTLRIARKYIKFLKLSPEWVGLDSLGGKSLPKGTIGEFDGMPVKEVTSSKMPQGVVFMITYKGSLISPMKIKDYKGHVDPPGLSGDLLEFRMMFDAFVLGNKADGVIIGVLPDTLVDTPTVTVSGTTATIASTTSGATFKYTTDGSDPRSSVEVKTGSSVANCTGLLIRCFAEAEGMFRSNVYEYQC